MKQFLNVTYTFFSFCMRKDISRGHSYGFLSHTLYLKAYINLYLKEALVHLSIQDSTNNMTSELY